MRALFASILVLGCVLPACSSPSTPGAPDTGARLDSTVPRDAAEGADGDAVDALTPADTGAETPDTGAETADSSAADAWSIELDTGTPELDASAPDTGSIDLDGGAIDGGGRDGGRRRDGGTDADVDAAGAAPGECSRGPCTPTCFRPYRCVTVCGGPVTECGCCPCAEGSIDTILCPPTM